MWVFSSSISGWSQVSPIILAFSALRNSKRNSVTQSRPAVNDSSRLMKPFYCLWRNSSTCKVSRKTLSGELTSFKKKKNTKTQTTPNTMAISIFFSFSLRVTKKRYFSFHRDSSVRQGWQQNSYPGTYATFSSQCPYTLSRLANWIWDEDFHWNTWAHESKLSS